MKNILFISLLTSVITVSAAPPAKSVIEIWVWGGPSQLETFDPKPDAPAKYNNGLKAINTNVPGIQISEMLPQLAKHADKYSIIRTMTHKHNGHETASYLMQTGREPGSGKVFPAIGALVAFYKSQNYQGDLPPYVILTKPKGRFAEEGFLGEKFKPLVTGGNPNAARFSVDGITPPSALSAETIAMQFEALEQFDSFGKFSSTYNPQVNLFDRAGEDARKKMSGSAAKVFDLSTESEETRNRYGRNDFGQACLVARKLVEAGVPYITINAQGWDSHKKHFETMKKKTAEMDQAVAALLEDLAEKKLLDTTIVWWSGEFGRTPEIQWEAPWNGGRNHYAKCFSAIIAGGGFQGGKVIGVSDSVAGTVVERPVAPQDLLGSILERCGIDPDSKFPEFTGVNAPLLPKESAAGRLREIYPRKGENK
ncbi:MAG: DUF1501 domain-containing protein [Lentisphaerae bacterium]|nr:DUF1501 domain-containing protein [Lentisphaerota bacterium]